MENRYLFLFLASGIVNDEGFWLIGVKNSDLKILDDETLLECHRKELIGHESAKDILNAINLNLDNLMNDLKNNSHYYYCLCDRVSIETALIFLNKESPYCTLIILPYIK